MLRRVKYQLNDIELTQHIAVQLFVEWMSLLIAAHILKL